MHRRTFLGLLVCAAAGTWAGPGAPPATLAWSRGDRNAEPEGAGVAFGLEEAARTAALLSVPFRQVPVGEAAVVVATGSPPRAPLVIDARCGSMQPLAPGVFAIEPGREARARALAGVAGGRTAVLWHAGRVRFGGSELNARWRARHAAPMQEADWAGWMAVKVALELLLRHAGASSLPQIAFDGHKGTPLRFGPDRRLRQPLYVLDAAGREVAG
jgi:hypothetical protein